MARARLLLRAALRSFEFGRELRPDMRERFHACEDLLIRIGFTRSKRCLERREPAGDRGRRSSGATLRHCLAISQPAAAWRPI